MSIFRPRILTIFNPFGTLLTCGEANLPVFPHPYQRLFGGSAKVSDIFKRGQIQVESMRKKLGFYLEKAHHRFNFQEGQDGRFTFLRGDGPPELLVDPESQAKTLFEMNLLYMEHKACRMLPDVEWQVRHPKLVRELKSLKKRTYLVAQYHHPEQIDYLPPGLFDGLLGSPFTKKELIHVADGFHLGPEDLLLVNQGDVRTLEMARDLHVELVNWGSQIFTFQELRAEVEQF